MTSDREKEAGVRQPKYEVGYRRPPAHTRYKRGQSGNPKGRLRQSRNLKTILSDVLSEVVLVGEGGRKRRMTKAEALVRSWLAGAFKNEPKALAALITVMRQCGYGEENAAQTPALTKSEADSILDEYLARVGASAGVRPDSEDTNDGGNS